MHSMHHESIKPVSYSFSRPVSSCCKLYFFSGTTHKGFCSKMMRDICKLFSIFALLATWPWGPGFRVFLLIYASHLSSCRILALCPLTNYQLHPSALWKRGIFRHFLTSHYGTFLKGPAASVEKKEFNKELHWPRRWKCALINLIRRKRILELNAILWAK